MNKILEDEEKTFRAIEKVKEFISKEISK